MPIIGSFVKVVAYILPWSNLFPLITILVTLIGFRGSFAVIRFIISVIRG